MAADSSSSLPRPSLSGDPIMAIQLPVPFSLGFIPTPSRSWRSSCQKHQLHLLFIPSASLVPAAPISYLEACSHQLASPLQPLHSQQYVRSFKTPTLGRVSALTAPPLSTLWLGPEIFRKGRAGPLHPNTCSAQTLRGSAHVDLLPVICHPAWSMPAL